MSIKQFLAGIPLARRIFLRLLRATARDISRKNPWTGDRLTLNSFKHKGYWFFGKDRERLTMERFRQYLRPGATVLEVGGHIGFISQYFAKLVGPEGKVIVFEPGSNNLPYIERNTAQLPQVRIERQAVSDHGGEATFYEDDITGQNNSLLDDYHGAAGVANSHKMGDAKKARTVSLTALDDYIEAHGLKVDFLKIDIEGNELNALRGAEKSLKEIPALMVEVTEHQAEVANLLQRCGYVLSDDKGNRLDKLGPTFGGNVFATKG
jgi:FkbM family methyltransferase